ncbi:MAG: hypothetical protein AB7L66_19705 [Gemmatimonadales bacterium]
MRRLWLGLIAGLAVVQAAAAQSQPVNLSMSLDPTVQVNGARQPIVYLRNLLTDERWTRELDNSLPLIVSFTLETWRSRDGWIDEPAGTITWRTVVTKEPLQEEYQVMVVVQDRLAGRPARFAVRDSAAKYLDRPQLIQTFPQRPGRFYYHVTVRITVLSDRDMDQLERFLAGDPDIDLPERGTTVGRGIRRFLQQIAGLPSQVIQARSEVFTVQPNDQ